MVQISVHPLIPRPAYRCIVRRDEGFGATVALSLGPGSVGRSARPLPGPPLPSPASIPASPPLRFFLLRRLFNGPAGPWRPDPWTPTSSRTADSAQTCSGRSAGIRLRPCAAGTRYSGKRASGAARRPVSAGCEPARAGSAQTGCRWPTWTPPCGISSAGCCRQGRCPERRTIWALRRPSRYRGIPAENEKRN